VRPSAHGRPFQLIEWINGHPSDANLGRHGDWTSEMVHVVRVEPAGIEFVAEHGETVMHAGRRAGIRWPTICEGYANCGLCYVDVSRNEARVSPPDDVETAMLCRMPKGANPAVERRLACQLRVEGDIVVVRQAIRSLGRGNNEC
jgi:2Fe-2S ferredoxin